MRRNRMIEELSRDLERLKEGLEEIRGYL